jgi:Ca2+-binding EF-hand superfamily protein
LARKVFQCFDFNCDGELDTREYSAMIDTMEREGATIGPKIQFNLLRDLLRGKKEKLTERIVVDVFCKFFGLEHVNTTYEELPSALIRKSASVGRLL